MRYMALSCFSPNHLFIVVGIHKTLYASQTGVDMPAICRRLLHDNMKGIPTIRSPGTTGSSRGEWRRYQSLRRPQRDRGPDDHFSSEPDDADSVYGHV